MLRSENVLVSVVTGSVNGPSSQTFNASTGLCVNNTVDCSGEVGMSTCIDTFNTTTNVYDRTYTCGSGYIQNTTAGTCELMQALSAPTFSLSAGTYAPGQSLVISGPPEATIKYTTNGSDPACSGSNTYTSPLTINTTQTVKAIACKAGSSPSSIASTGEYIISTVTCAWRKDYIGQASDPAPVGTVMYGFAGYVGWSDEVGTTTPRDSFVQCTYHGVYVAGSWDEGWPYRTDFICSADGKWYAQRAYYAVADNCASVPN